MKGGDTFLRGGAKKHLWVVVSDPAANPTDPVLIVSLTTHQRRLESACTLMPGDHRFVTHKTVIHYRMAELESNANLDSKIGKHLLDSHDPMASDVLKRIRVGAAKSKHLRRECRRLLASQGLIDC